MARAALGMPARHLERVTTDLPRRQQEWLASVCAELWPHDEYTEIVRNTPPGALS